MNEKEYYSTITDYNQLVRQKGFNPHASNPKRLSELSQKLIKDISIQIAMIDRATNRLNADSSDIDQTAMKVSLTEQKYALITLQQKIYLGHFLSICDYETTFYGAPKIPLSVKMFAHRKYNYCSTSMFARAESNDDIMFKALIADYNYLLSGEAKASSSAQKLSSIRRSILQHIETNIDVDRDKLDDDAKLKLNTMIEIKEKVLSLSAIDDNIANLWAPTDNGRKVVSAAKFGAVVSMF